MITTQQPVSANNGKDFASRIAAVCAYLERGMPREALTELNALPPEFCNEWRAQVLRVSVYMDLDDWESMHGAALHLAAICPDDPKWPLCVAYATRRLESVKQAKAVLLEAEKHFPNDSGVQYNLACFAAQLGELPAANRYLRAACRLNSQWRESARHEPDLAPLRIRVKETRSTVRSQGE